MILLHRQQIPTINTDANIDASCNRTHYFSTGGQISLQVEILMLIGTDLDKAFSRYESSQNFNLVDFAAYYAGSFGLVVTKGYNFANIFQGTEGSSSIRKLVSNWKLEHGHALSQDVAMVTNENRITLEGRLDFVSDAFDDVIVALIDARAAPRSSKKCTAFS